MADTAYTYILTVVDRDDPSAQAWGSVNYIPNGAPDDRESAQEALSAYITRILHDRCTSLYGKDVFVRLADEPGATEPIKSNRRSWYLHKFEVRSSAGWEVI